MKSLLSENMLRFGTKNLTATSKQELIVKSIMETIDQHGLHNVIKHKLSEDIEAKPDQAMLGQAMKIIGTMQKLIGQGTAEGSQMIAAISKITAENYSACRYYMQTKGVNGKRYDRISDWLGNYVDKATTSGAGTSAGGAGPIGGVRNAILGVDTAKFFNNHMYKVLGQNGGESLVYNF